MWWKVRLSTLAPKRSLPADTINCRRLSLLSMVERLPPSGTTGNGAYPAWMVAPLLQNHRKRGHGRSADCRALRSDPPRTRLRRPAAVVCKLLALKLETALPKPVGVGRWSVIAIPAGGLGASLCSALEQPNKGSQPVITCWTKAMSVQVSCVICRVVPRDTKPKRSRSWSSGGTMSQD